MLFKNPIIIDEKGEVINGLDILVKHGVIAQIGANLAADGEQIVDCSGLYLTPGFCALHTHTPMNIFKGIAEDIHIDRWFNEEIWPYESNILPGDVYAGAKLAIAELLNNGVTAFADHYFQGEQIARAALECGAKADIAHTIFGTVSEQASQAEIDECIRLIEKYEHEKNINIRFGPHSPYLCGEELLRRIVGLAKQYGTGIHLHVSETQAQLDTSLELTGKTPFEVTHDAGGFTVPCIVAHGLYIQGQDIKLLNDDTFIPVSPKTYMKLGMGEGTIWRFYDELNLCIGTDGAASSNTLNPLEQARLFALIGKWRDNAEQFKVQYIWQLLMSGHNALNFNSGKIAVGCSADFNVWNLNTPETAPVYNPLISIIYSAECANNIVHTIIDGKFIKRDYKLLLDREAIVAQAVACQQGILARSRGDTKNKF